MSRRRRRGIATQGSGVLLPPSALNGNRTLFLDSRFGLFTTSAGSTPATADGDPTGLWKDQSGGARDFSIAIAGQRPSLQLLEINNLPCVRFDGTDDRLASVALSNFVTNSDFSAYVVIRPTAINTNNATIYANDPVIADSSGNWGIHLKSAPTLHGTVFDGASSKLTTSTPVVGSWQRVHFRLSGGNLVISVGAGAENSVACGNISSLASLVRLGVTFDNSQFLDADIACIHLYNAGHNASERAAMAAYLQQLYAVA